MKVRVEDSFMADKHTWRHGMVLTIESDDPLVLDCRDCAVLPVAELFGVTAVGSAVLT